MAKEGGRLLNHRKERWVRPIGGEGGCGVGQGMRGVCRREDHAGGFVTWRRGFSRCDRMAQSRLARMAKVRAQWWFSITLMSL